LIPQSCFRSEAQDFFASRLPASYNIHSVFRTLTTGKQSLIQGGIMQVLTTEEINAVSAGLSTEEAGVIAGVFAAGAAMTGSFALVPGLHSPFAGGISALMAFGAGVFGIYAASDS
jgi:hypothetical protein